MPKVKFKVNYAGVRELLTGDKMKGVLEEYGQHAMAQLGSGYEIETTETTGATRRAKVQLSARTWAARKDNLDNNTLLKAIGR